MPLYDIQNNFFQLHHTPIGAAKLSRKTLKYSLSFVSLIAPGTVKASSTLFAQIRSKQNKKLFLKQSYLLLT
jgi:hypothetical protein